MVTNAYKQIKGIYSPEILDVPTTATLHFCQELGQELGLKFVGQAELTLTILWCGRYIAASRLCALEYEAETTNA